MSIIEYLINRFHNRRWEMVWMLFSGVLIVYILRVNISVAAQDMRDELNWTEAQKGLVLSSFYWGYAIGQVPSSRIIQKYGAKWVFGFSVLLTSVFTLFVPVAAKTSFGLTLFIRCLVGLCESASFPAVFHFFPIWIPVEEKTFMIPAIISGMYMGEIFGFSLSGILTKSTLTIGGVLIGGWPSVFYIFGFLGVIWFPYWAIMAYESPDRHPHVTNEELALIQRGKEKARLVSVDEKSRSLISSVTPASPSPDFDYTYNSPMIKETNPAVPKRLSNIDESDMPGVSLNEEFGLDEHSAFLPNQLRSNQSFSESRSKSKASNQNLASYPSVMSEEDRNRIADMVATEIEREELARRTPWKAFFSHPVALTLLVNSFTFGFIGFTLLSEMPSFLTDELGFDLESAGILCVFPYLALFLSSLSFGAIFEYMQWHHGWSINNVRQAAQWIAFLGSASGLVLCGFMGNSYAAYSFMILSQALMGSVQSGLSCAYSDVSPNYSSVLNSVGNMMSATAGIVGPLITAALLDTYPGILGWRLLFLITLGMAGVSLTFWSIWQTSDVVPALNKPVKLNTSY